MSDTKSAPAETKTEAKIDEPVVLKEPEIQTEVVIPPMPVAPVHNVSEMDILRQRADILGLAYSTQVTAEQLRAKINTAMTDPGKAQAESTQESVDQARARQYQEAYLEHMQLIRVRITNLNPQKADLHGEIFTFANSILGAVRKFIPYGEVTDNGYYLPKCIYEELKARKFTQIKTRQGEHGQILPVYRDVNEFALEVLPALSPEELRQLAIKQAAAQGVDLED